MRLSETKGMVIAMYKAYVRLDTVTDAKRFVNLCNVMDFPISLVSERYVVDAKSLMGIFSLDLSKPAEVQAECSEDHEFVKKLEAFTVHGG